MRSGLPSVTASAVALARGVAPKVRALPDAPVDSLARELLPFPFALLERVIEGSASAVPALGPVWRALSFGLIDHMALRTAAIDDAVREAVRAGARQLVILGAGLDARAFRMEELRDALVFEVDHPATQGHKRERVAGKVPLAREVRFVSIDFQQGSLVDVLADAGHDALEKSFWIWEGVTMYLPIEATRATLQAIAARSAAGSRLAMTYVPPAPGGALGFAIQAGTLAMRVVGEPMVGRMSPEVAAAELGQVGFSVISDTDAAAWVRRYSGGSPRRWLLPSHLVVAERRAPEEARKP